jgi:hypothetical protein
MISMLNFLHLDSSVLCSNVLLHGEILTGDLSISVDVPSLSTCYHLSDHSVKWGKVPVLNYVSSKPWRDMRVEVALRLLTSALCGSECTVSCRDCFSAGENLPPPQYPLHRRLGGRQSCIWVITRFTLIVSTGSSCCVLNGLKFDVIFIVC